MKKPRILVVGSINMDMICTAKRLPDRGETVMGEKFSTAAGGKGANQAVQAARLGADVTLVGGIGCDEFGLSLIEGMKKNGVNCSEVKKYKNESTGVALIEVENTDHGAENRILVISGANNAIKTDDVAFLKEKISEFDMVILQNEIPTEINLAVARYARDKGVAVMLNPAPAREIPNEMRSLLSYISPNEHEAYLLTGYDASDEAQRAHAANALNAYATRGVIITLGKNGCLYGEGNNVYLRDAVQGVKAIDPTAAGDSFVASFCTALCLGADIQRCLTFASYAASITVSRSGAQPSLPTIDEVVKIMKAEGEDVSPFLALL